MQLAKSNDFCNTLFFYLPYECEKGGNSKGIQQRGYKKRARNCAIVQGTSYGHYYDNISGRAAQNAQLGVKRVEKSVENEQEREKRYLNEPRDNVREEWQRGETERNRKRGKKWIEVVDGGETVWGMSEPEQAKQKGFCALHLPLALQ